MKVKHLKVERFRGIRELDWTLEGNTVCLVGQGDSAKSTILDAIELVLSSRWNLSFSDSDFYNADCSTPIVIKATVGELPPELLTEDRFGLFQRGWDLEKGLVDEPDDGHEVVLTIQLFVDDSLEPQWTVITDRYPEGKKISSRDRERIGVTRLGTNVDRDLSWGRGSVLARFTDDSEDLSRAMADAYRCARRSFASGCTPTLDDAAHRAQKAAGQLGVGASAGEAFRPGLDTRIVTPIVAAVCLHDGEIPLRLAGLGSRRLTAFALQRTGIALGAVVLIDEIEHGLEPYRLRNLLRFLQTPPDSSPSAEAADSASLGQVIMVTHSPVVVTELMADQVSVVHRECDRIRILQASRELQPLIRACPSALLSQRVVVCEGRTELGLLRGLENYWAERHGGIPPAYYGVDFTEGGGRTDGPTRALHLANLCYEVAYLGDSDQPIEPNETILEQNGVQVILWGDMVSLEQRICLDLPFKELQKVMDLAVEILGEKLEDPEQAVLSRIANQLDCALTSLGKEVASWFAPNRDEAMIRQAIGAAAKDDHSNKKRKGWFKDIEAGKALAKLVAAALPSIPNSDLARKLRALEDWMYA